MAMAVGVDDGDWVVPKSEIVIQHLASAPICFDCEAPERSRDLIWHCIVLCIPVVRSNRT
jgi:hypothetical protein